ncbi:VWA domain-containing protein [Fusobacterium sp.]|uniref:vWA domain-containing protein n=2 Tax=Fusobacterium sp. TaxID=68766 RepID=UPI00260E7A7C|nr:VWA domain-containing protein [Fusobacterium sp.]
MYKFQDPYFFLLIPLIVYLFFRKNKNSTLTVPSINNIKSYAFKSKKYLIGKYLIFISCLLMVVGLARPQIVSEHKIKKEGIDIVVALDLSKSMLQEDFNPNRLEKSKELLSQFISKRTDDRIGLVIFGGDAYTKIPLTFDTNMLKDVIEKIDVNDITSNNQTAIGMGVGVAINRLKDSNSKSKVIILMTDGENNSGELSPMDATKLAKNFGIKIYTIGIGSYERNIPWFGGVRKIKNNELDENLLNAMAKETNGQYFRASDEKSFANIFDEINKLEKTEVEKQEFLQREELYFNFVKTSLLFLIVGIFLEFLIFIRIP